ncbi:MAG: DNA primase [Ruminococcaceae bacterium]|nr:DNA primase [Oscillospiraceae bacterium]
MAYPKTFIEEIKMRNDLETVIGRYVDLKRAGSNMVGCCPFHSERTPSFTVFPEKNFYCFGCGAGGDVITFIMRIENLDYQSAVQYLADAAGIPVPKDEGFFVRKEKEVLSRERNYEMNKIAARHYHDNLISEDGKEALQYFLDRGLSPATIRRFGLGYAKNSFDDLYKLLLEKGFTVDEMKAAFLCGISKKGTPFDMFRNRVMFPIIDTSGRVIAFGGRVMDGSLPKYLNSSDTPVFKKKDNLFALNYAKNSCVGNANSDKAKSGELILCEGYMDVIALHQAGFSGAVATLGTAITPDQARLIARYAKTLYVSYDSDAAGKRADEKAIKYMNEVGVDVKILKVTGAKDPDEYIKKYGAESFRKLMTGASGQIDYRLNEIISKYNIEIPDERVSMLQEACSLIATIGSDIKRDVYAMRLSQMSGTDKEAILSEVKKRIRQNGREEKRKFLKTTEDTLRRYGDRINPDAMKNIKGASAEEQIIGILLLYPEYMSKISEDTLNESDFITDFNKNVFSALKKIYSESEVFEISDLNEFFSPEQMGRIHSMYRKRRELTVNDISTLSELIGALKKEKEKETAKKAGDITVDELASYLKAKRNTDKKD